MEMVQTSLGIIDTERLAGAVASQDRHGWENHGMSFDGGERSNRGEVVRVVEIPLAPSPFGQRVKLGRETFSLWVKARYLNDRFSLLSRTTPTSFYLCWAKQ